MVKDSKSAISCWGGLHFVKQLVVGSGVSFLIDSTLPSRGAQARYSDSSIIESLACSICCGGQYLEDLNSLSAIGGEPGSLDHCSSDTVSYRVAQLAQPNNVINNNGVIHEFNAPEVLNLALCRTAVKLNPQWCTRRQTVDIDATIVYHDKPDGKMSYKGRIGYHPTVAAIDNHPVFIENRNGNTNAHFCLDGFIEQCLLQLREEGAKVGYLRLDGAGYQKEVIKRLHRDSKGLTYFVRAKEPTDLIVQHHGSESWQKVTIKKQELDYLELPYMAPGLEDINPKGKKAKARMIIYRYKSKSKANQVDLFKEDYRYYAIVTNDLKRTACECIEFYNQRGTAEQLFDRIKNDFNWNHLPYNNMPENTVYMFFTAMAMLIYRYVITKVSKHFKELTPTSRLKRFIFYFMALACKWVKKARKWHLKIYTDRPYEKLTAPA